MTLVVGATGPAASARQIGEDVRVAVAAWDAGAVDPIAATLLSLYDDDRRLALARQLTPLRRALFERLITETAQANASFALTTGLAEVVPILTAPLNLGDIVILTKNQLLLGYRIVLAAGRDGRTARADRGDRRRARQRIPVPAGRAAARGPHSDRGHRAQGRHRLQRHVGDRTRDRAVGHGGPRGHRRRPCSA